VLHEALILLRGFGVHASPSASCPPFLPALLSSFSVCAQAELEDAHKADPVVPTMTADEAAEVERVFKDF
jgi:hypothetical protein